MSQAPGLSGIARLGHCSSAATRASCASSSARPTSRTIRARPAMSLADSILQTASIARWVSAGFTATHHTWLPTPSREVYALAACCGAVNTWRISVSPSQPGQCL